MAAIIQNITKLVNAIFIGTPAGDGVEAVPSWISTIVSTATSNPLILAAICLPLVGLGVGLLKRLFSTKA